MNTEHPGRDATSDTTPLHIWKSAVIEIAQVSEIDAHRYATRERIQRAYRAGEPAWMAADMVRQFVTVGKREDRADGETNSLLRRLRDSVTK